MDAICHVEFDIEPDLELFSDEDTSDVEEQS